VQSLILPVPVRMPDVMTKGDSRMKAKSVQPMIVKIESRSTAPVSSQHLFPIYENEYIFLSPFGELELQNPNYRAWMHSPVVTRHNSHGLFPYTEDQARDFHESIKKKERIVFAIYSKRGHKDAPGETYPPHLVGNCTLQSINMINRSCEFAIVIGDVRYWGMGFGQMALRFCLQHAFQRLGMHRVWTGTAQSNIGMQKVAEKCGMIWEGNFRQAVFLNGAFEDVVEYGILKSDWSVVTNG